VKHQGCTETAARGEDSGGLQTPDRTRVRVEKPETRQRPRSRSICIAPSKLDAVERRRAHASDDKGTVCTPEG